MPNGPPDLSRDSEARDTLEVSEDELKRASQLPLDEPAHTPPPLPPASLAPTSAASESGEDDDLAPAFRLMLALAGALLFAFPFAISAAHGGAPSKFPAATASVAEAAATPARVGVTTLVTSRGPAPGSNSTDLACTEATALEPEQLIELPAVRVNRPGASSAAGDGAAESAPRKASAVAAVPRGRFFDPSAAESALRAVSGGLGECGPDAKGKVNVAVTFAPSGSATVATVEEDRLRATPAGSCVARHLRDARVLGFNGPGETVRTTLVVD